MYSLTYCTFHRMYYNVNEVELAEILLKLNSGRTKRTGVKFEIKNAKSEHGNWDGTYNIILSVSGDTHDPSKLQEEYEWAMSLIDKSLGEE